jgi:DNA-binding transcriptional ArsR family regulator
MPEPAPLDLIERKAAAAAVLHPLRSRILAELRRPDSAAGLARRIDLPRQKLNYHLRQLEKEGLVELVEERRKGNCTERVVRASAHSYLISPATLGPLATDPDKLRDKFSATYLVALAARAVRDIARLSRGAARAGKRLPTLSLQTEIRFASPEAQNRFAEELSTQLALLTAKYHDDKAPEGRPFRLFVGSYPKPKDDEAPDREEA